jgi:hypothetical protein
MKNNQNTATHVINICLLFMFFGAFTFLNGYYNKEKTDPTENIIHTFQISEQKTIPVQSGTNAYPDFYKFWIGIDSCNKHYISSVRNSEMFFKLTIDTEFKLLSFRYLELKQLIFEDHFHYFVRNNNTDYSVFS